MVSAIANGLNEAGIVGHQDHGASMTQVILDVLDAFAAEVQVGDR